jgi:hypothetical protein
MLGCVEADLWAQGRGVRSDEQAPLEGKSEKKQGQREYGNVSTSI